MTKEQLEHLKMCANRVHFLMNCTNEQFEKELIIIRSERMKQQKKDKKTSK